MPKSLGSICAAVMVLLYTAQLALADCGFRESFRRADEEGTRTVKVYEGKPVPALSNSKPLLFIVTLKVNTDGTRISYSESDPRARRCLDTPGSQGCAINDIRNAYRNHNRPVSDFERIRDNGYADSRDVWSVLSPDIIEKDARSQKPCITSDGYIISMTADVAVDGGFGRIGDCDPQKWIDALTMPAIVLPKNTTAVPSQFQSKGAVKRSVVVAISKGPDYRVVPGIVGDLGPVKEIGEANVAMNQALNGLPKTDLPKYYKDAINRFQAGKTAILVFPGSSNKLARPITPERISQTGLAALTAFGGKDRLLECIRTEVDSSF